jgi:hypothetical protein
MLKKPFISIALLLSLSLFSCNLQTPLTATTIPTNTAPELATPSETSTQMATATQAPTETSTTAPVPIATLTQASATPAETPVSIPASNQYIDDRSTPVQVIVSLYNAIDRKEYSRAYSYWDNPQTSLGDFDVYASGYQDTATVDLVFGMISADAGMSQIRFIVPVILKVTTTSHTQQNFSACYIVHETNPGVYGAPPFMPMGIEQGSAQVSSTQADDLNVLSTACSAYPAGYGPAYPTTNLSLDINKDNFVDNRSGPIETISSFLNSLNRQEYVRAYSYFQDPASFPGTYDPWAAGYADTGSITVIFGTVQSEGAAGSIYYKVPLAQQALSTSNVLQTFVGCYTLRLPQPANQAVPPFHPLGIVSGNFNLVANDANLNALISTACQ